MRWRLRCRAGPFPGRCRRRAERAPQARTSAPCGGGLRRVGDECDRLDRMRSCDSSGDPQFVCCRRFGDRLVQHVGPVDRRRRCDEFLQGDVLPATLAVPAADDTAAGQQVNTGSDGQGFFLCDDFGVTTLVQAHGAKAGSKIGQVDAHRPRIPRDDGNLLLRAGLLERIANPDRIGHDFEPPGTGLEAVEEVGAASRVIDQRRAAIARDFAQRLR